MAGKYLYDRQGNAIDPSIFQREENRDFEKADYGMGSTWANRPQDLAGAWNELSYDPENEALMRQYLTSGPNANVQDWTAEESNAIRAANNRSAWEGQDSGPQMSIEDFMKEFGFGDIAGKSWDPSTGNWGDYSPSGQPSAPPQQSQPMPQSQPQAPQQQAPQAPSAPQTSAPRPVRPQQSSPQMPPSNFNPGSINPAAGPIQFPSSSVPSQMPGNPFMQRQFNPGSGTKPMSQGFLQSYNNKPADKVAAPSMPQFSQPSIPNGTGGMEPGPGSSRPTGQTGGGSPFEGPLPGLIQEPHTPIDGGWSSKGPKISIPKTGPR